SEHLMQACSWMHGAPKARAQMPVDSLRFSKWARNWSHSSSVGVRYSSLGRAGRRRVMKARWTPADLERRLAAGLARLGGYRTRRFPQLYWPAHDQRQKRLAAGRSAGFEDMPVQAAGHLDAGTADAGSGLITAGESQVA